MREVCIYNRLLQLHVYRPNYDSVNFGLTLETTL